MNTFLFLVGLLGMIGSLVLLVINLIRKKSKKKGLISLGICLVVFVIGVATTPSNEANLENSEDVAAAESVPVQEELKEDTQKVDEKENIEKLKEIYENEIDPWYSQVIAEYDSSWEELWTKTMEDFSNGSISDKELKNNIIELRDNRLKPLQEQVFEFKTPNEFTKTDKVSSFRENIFQAIDSRINATEQFLSMLDETTKLDTDFIKEIIERGDKYMYQSVASMTELKVELGVPK